MYVTSIKILSPEVLAMVPSLKPYLFYDRALFRIELQRDYREDIIIFVVEYCNATGSDTQKNKMKLTFKNGQSWSISSYFRVKKKEKSKSRKRSKGSITQYSNQFPQESMTKSGMKSTK